MKKLKLFCFIIYILIAGVIDQGQLRAQALKNDPALDEKVKQFIDAHSGQWHDLNISAADGQLLYDLVIKGNYKRAESARR